MLFWVPVLFLEKVAQKKTRGSKDAIFKDVGLENSKWYGFLSQKPLVLGTWTLWEMEGPEMLAVKMANFVGSYCKALCRNFQEPAKMMVLVVEGMPH